MLIFLPKKLLINKNYYLDAYFEERKVFYITSDLIFSMLNRTELGILNCLIEMQSFSLKKIAKKLGISPQTVYNTFKKLRKAGVLTGEVPSIDLVKLGYNVTMFILISANYKDIPELTKTLERDKNIVSIFQVAGKHDLIAIAKYKSASECSKACELLSKNEKIRNLEASMAFETFKESNLPFPLT